MTRTPPENIHYVRDDALGLEAVIVIDSTVLGPAAGGIRTAAYASIAAAQEDAEALAEAMTIKCALAGLDAGGGKCVVIDKPELNRAEAFKTIGRAVEGLSGQFRTAGDFGTTASDLAALSTTTRFVHLEGGRLADAVADSHIVCLESALSFRADRQISDLSVAIQGCGSIGSAIARRLAAAGARLVLADTDQARAESLADELDAKVADPDRVLFEPVDVVAPCARGGVISPETAERIRARVVCGGANNIAASARAEFGLAERGILLVPDCLSSAGAVIEGIARSVMGLSKTRPMIDELGPTLVRLLADAKARGQLPSHAARRLARGRLAEATGDNL